MRKLLVAVALLFTLSTKSQQVFHESIKSHAHFKAEDRYTYQKDSLQQYQPMKGTVLINAKMGVIKIFNQRYILLQGINSEECYDYILKQYIALGSNRDTVSLILKVYQHPSDCQILIAVISRTDYDFYKMDDAELEEQ